MESTHKKSKDDERKGVNQGATNDDVGGVENSPSALKVNTDSDPSDEGNSPSAVKVKTKSDPSDEGEISGDSSDSSLGYWDYVTDPCYSTDEIPFSASQPCGCVRGVSYTPPGWMRKPKARKCTKKSKPPAAKRINLDNQLGQD